MAAPEPGGVNVFLGELSGCPDDEGSSSYAHEVHFILTLSRPVILVFIPPALGVQPKIKEI
jgi:hypothetical protein